MPLEFFRFPFDIRERIYQEVFQTSCQDAIITPDQDRTRRTANEKDLKKHTVNGGALLSTCQQVHEEALPFLWRNDSFYFDDTPHGCGSVYLDPDAPCHCPPRYIYPDSPGGPCVIESKCNGQSFCRRQFQVPVCDYTAMPGWLRKIGRNNRLRIRHIELHFTGPIFTMEGARNDLEPLQPHCGVEFIDQAFQILASAHNLESVTISFPTPTDVFGSNGIAHSQPVAKRLMDAFGHWNPDYKFVITSIASIVSTIQAVKTVRVIGAMSELHGSRLSIEDDGQVIPFEHPAQGTYYFSLSHLQCSIETLRNLVEAGYDLRTKVEPAPVSWARPFVHQYSYLSLGENPR